MAWLSGYTYRKLKPVNATAAGAQTLYQVELLVGESSGAVGEEIDCESHCLDFPKDLRFTDTDGTTKHNYWVESISGVTPNRLATIWIKVATIPVAGSINLYLYYNKAADAGESSISNTFPQSVENRTSAFCEALSFNTGYASRMKVTLANNSATKRFGMANSGLCWPTEMYFFNAYNNNTKMYAKNAGGQTGEDWFAYNAGTDMYDVTFKTGEIKFYKNSVLKSTITTTLPSVNLGLYMYEESGADVTVVFGVVRKYADPEPTWGTSGAEEEAPTWLSGYTYRKLKPVNATAAGAQTLYQVELLVGESSGAVGEDIDCESHCIDFPKDIRFTDTDKLTKHDYWVESISGITPNRLATVWVEVATIPVAGSIDLYIYYGKAADAGESNGDNTLIFFDDFANFEWASSYKNVSWAKISDDVYANGVYTPQYPPGIYVASENKTYIIWQTPSCGRKIIEYNHLTSSFQNETDIGGYTLNSDGHGAPALGIDNNGYLYVFYGSHSSTMYYKKSINTYDITSWGSEQTWVEGTYPQIFYTNGKLWVLYRNAVKEWGYRTTSDGGLNWSSAVEITDFSGLANFWGVYARTMKAPNGDIHMVWLWRDGANNYYNLYYAYYDISAGQWKKRDGSVLTLPITEPNADKIFTGNKTWIWGLDVDSNNEPYILFAYSGDNKIKLAKWKNSAWNTYDAVSYTFLQSNSVGAFKVDSASNMRIIMDSDDHKTAKLYKSIDGGENWVYDKIVGEDLFGKAYNVGNYQTVFNANGELEFLFGPGVWPGSGGIAAAWGKDSDFTHEEPYYPTGYTIDNKWQSAETSLYSAAGGNLILLNGGDTFSDCLNSKNNFSGGYAIESRQKVIGSTPCEIYLASEESIATRGVKDEISSRLGDSFVAYINGGYSTGGTAVANTWYRCKLKIPASGDASGYVYSDDEQTLHVSKIGTPAYRTGYIFLHQRPSSTGYLDWIFVRKYVSPEPTWGTSGAEEEEGATNIQILMVYYNRLRM